jgi:hypothetical protein
MTDNPFTDFFAAEDKAAMDEGRGQQPNGHDDATSWGDPDMGVPGMHRRTPPQLPVEVFGRSGATGSSKRPKPPPAQPITLWLRCLLPPRR